MTTLMNERTQFFMKNISLTLYSRKGWCWLCVRGELETGTDCYILTQVLLTIGQVIPKTQKWYLMLPCLTLSIVRYRSMIKGSNPGKGLMLILAWLLNRGSLRAQSPLSAAGSQFGILSPANLNRFYARLYDCLTLTCFRCSSAYLHGCISWLTARSRSICYNYSILIFQNSTCGIFLHVCLHPPHRHILQIMLKDNNSKNTKRNYTAKKKKT